VPVQVSGLTSAVRAISASSANTCALTSAGGMRCWGSNVEGQLGDGSMNSSGLPVTPVGLNSGVMAIGQGAGTTCASVAAGVRCWGDNLWGAVGDGTNTDRSTPVAVSGLSAPALELSGHLHTCALTANRSLQCWGYAGSGQLGNLNSSARNTPGDVYGVDGGVQHVSTNYWGTCAVFTSGELKCWGGGSFGQLGVGDLNSRSIPDTVVGLGSGVREVAAGERHTCARLTTGAIKCWGALPATIAAAYVGQLGHGMDAGSSVPIDVPF
jgi:alpha-tubulin suppressor-like RCC1 family protein